MKDREVWEVIKSFDYPYMVSNLGKILYPSRKNKRSDGRVSTYRKRITVGRPCLKGYLCVSLRRRGKHLQFYVHRLVLLTFKGNPKGKKNQTNHKNGDKKDNRLVNLEWATNQQNIIHSIKTGLRKVFDCGRPGKRKRILNANRMVS